MMPTHNPQGKHPSSLMHMIAAALVANAIAFDRASDLAKICASNLFSWAAKGIGWVQEVGSPRKLTRASPSSRELRIPNHRPSRGNGGVGIWTGARRFPEAPIHPETGRCTPIGCIPPICRSDVILALRIDLS